MNADMIHISDIANPIFCGLQYAKGVRPAASVIMVSDSKEAVVEAIQKAADNFKQANPAAQVSAVDKEIGTLAVALVNDDMVAAWLCVKAETAAISRGLAAGIAYDYESLNIYDRVVSKLKEKGVSADAIETEEAQLLIADLASAIDKDIQKYGCEEDWSFDEEFKIFAEQIDKLAEMEE